MIKEDTQKDRYLIFSLGKEDYGIEIKYVIEIVGMHPITVIPDTHDYIKGVINLRGKIIPVIDVRNRFLKESIDYHDRTCIIVVNMKGVSVGLIVDKVVEVLNIPEYNISEPPKVSKQSYQRYIKGIGKVADKIRLILDLENLLNNDDFISFK